MPQCPRLQMLDLKAAAATEATAGVFAFPAGGLWGLARHRLLMSAGDPFADVNRVSRHVRKVQSATLHANFGI
jgi:hypothetical protein